MKQLQGKVAVITGAGRGIGRAIATVYAKEGASVVVASRTPSTVEDVVAEIRRDGGIALGVPTDVGHKDQVYAMVDKAMREFGTVDILVNNAQGFGTETNPVHVPAPLEETTDEEWDYSFRTGAQATFWAMKAAFPYLKAKGGKVINFGSVAGMLCYEGYTCYSATKEAVRSLSRTAAREWGKYGINVNVINPMLRTDTFDAFNKKYPDKAAAIVEQLALKRMGDPVKDGGPLAVFLASDASNYITGMTFMLDGGLYIAP